MKQLKNVCDILNRLKAKNPDLLNDQDSLELADANDYLADTRTFEYEGKVRLQGITLRLTDIEKDFDDILKLIIDKEAQARLSITVNGGV